MKQIVLGALCLVVPAIASAAPTVELDDRAVVISGVTPGGSVAVLGVGRRWQGAVTVRSLDVDQVVDDDRDGVIHYVPGMPLGDQAVFVGVDVETGDHGIAARGSLPKARPAPLAAKLLEGPVGKVDRLRLPGGFAYTLWVRPGEGAWWTGVSDGNRADQDASEDGFFTLAPTWAEALEGGRPAPQAFAARDVLVVIQPKALSWSVTSLEAPMAALVSEVSR